MTTYSVTQQIHFNYGHRLMDYDGKCAHLHGHNAVVEITLESSQLDSCGMVMDFTILKRNLGVWIDQTFDHKMLLRKDDPLVAILKEQGEPIVETAQNPTAEVIAELIFEHAKSQELPIKEIKVWESPTQCASVKA